MTGREGEREGGEGGRRERADQRRKPTRQGGREGSRRREEGTRETVLGSKLVHLKARGGGVPTPQGSSEYHVRIAMLGDETGRATGPIWALGMKKGKRGATLVCQPVLIGKSWRPSPSTPCWV